MMFGRILTMRTNLLVKNSLEQTIQASGSCSSKYDAPSILRRVVFENWSFCKACRPVGIVFEAPYLEQNIHGDLVLRGNLNDLGSLMSQESRLSPCSECSIRTHHLADLQQLELQRNFG